MKSEALRVTLEFGVLKVDAPASTVVGHLMDGGVVGVGAHKAGDLAHGFHVGADLLIVAAQPAGVGGDHRFVDAAGAVRLAVADLPDDGLGGKVFIAIGVSAAGGDGLGDLLLLGAA